jgi:hypothetical protein
MTAKERRKKLAKGLNNQVEKDRKKAEQGKNPSIVIGNIPLWKCGVGEHIIDVLPFFAGANHPDKAEGENTYRLEYYMHRDVGHQNARVLCLQAMGLGACPICEHQADLIEEKADESKWKPLRPKNWVLFNVVVYDKGEEKKGIQIWDAPYFYSMENIMDIAKIRSRGGKPSKTTDFANPDKGKSISFEVKAAKGQNDYPKYTGFKFEPRDYKIKDSLLDDCLVLDELIPIPTYEEVSELYFGSGQGRKAVDDDGDDDSDESDSALGLEELDEAEDIDDLKVIVSKYDLSTKIKKASKFKKTRRLIKEEFEAMDDDDDDDGDEDGDEDEDNEENALTSEDVEDMSTKELKRVIKANKLDLDPDDYEDETELAEAIIEEMELI